MDPLNLAQVSYRVARRIVIGIVGFTVCLIGIAMLALPGPAVIVIPAGLAILSLEFAFARRWLQAVRQRISDMAQGQRLKKNGRKD